MKKKIKISLILSLAIIFGCFSNVFATTNQNNKINKIAEAKKSVRLLDNTNDNGVDQYTKLLMHMDDGAFKDECGHDVTDNGVILDTNNKRFGEGSANFNGYSNYLSLNNYIDFNFLHQLGTNGKWTIDCWVKLNNFNNNYQTIIDTSNGTQRNSGIGLYIESSRKIYLFISNSSSFIIQYTSEAMYPNDTNWHHIEISYDQSLSTNNCSMFIDGTLFSQGTKTSETPSTVNCVGCCIGQVNNNCYLNGNIDELRISKDIVRHTSSFTPPAAPYGNISATGITLNKTTDTLNLRQTDNTLTATVTPDNATNKTVKWTSSDKNIVQVDENTGVITAGTTPGTAIITATIDGTTISTTCTVIVTDQQPTNPTDSSDKAVLNITMTNGQVKQYNVTMDTVNKFISWYRLRSAGSGDPLYEFNITQTSNPSIVKTDYVVFDKISSFEVDDYTK